MSYINEMNETFSDSFMQPEAFIGADIEEALIEEGLDYEADKYYARLSASGYLDCTEFSGPFDTLEDAAQFLIETYGEE